MTTFAFTFQVSATVMTCHRFAFSKFIKSRFNSSLCISVPTGVASIELTARTDTSFSIVWAEPQNTDLVRYDVSISPNDGAENLPIRVNKLVDVTDLISNQKIISLCGPHPVTSNLEQIVALFVQSISKNLFLLHCKHFDTTKKISLESDEVARPKFHWRCETYAKLPNCYLTRKSSCVNVRGTPPTA